MHALLVEKIHPTAVRMLREASIAVTCEHGSPSEADLVTVLRGVALLGIRSRTRLTRRVFEQAPDLIAVGTYCIGTNQIDLEAASDHGVAVFNAPFSNTRSVAELVIAEIILLVRRLYDKMTRAHQGIWDKSADHAREVRGKTLGIIGYGNIGSQVSALAEALGMNVLYYDLVDKLSIGNASRVKDLHELLRRSDVITLHVDGSPANENLIDREEFDAMRDGAILLNLSRGHVVNLEELALRIRSGKVAGAAVDVFPREPRDSSEQLATPLQGLPNVLLTPHIGGSTEEAQENIGEFVSQKLLDYLRTGSTFTSVNFPKLALPDPGDRGCRMLHVHRNVPGVLSQINGVFARHGLNVVAQYLRTSETIGYAVADVDREFSPPLQEELGKVDHTIRLRIR